MPFRPECGYEHRKGVVLCPGCRVVLVHSLPPAGEPAVQFVDFREILFTYNPGDIAIIISILDAEGIRYFFKGEHFLSVQPLADPARLMVMAGQEAEAREILKGLDLTITASRVRELEDVEPEKGEA